MRPRVCLNMIVKNEAAVIDRCLRAALPHIDCYAICDTGSTDGTPDLILYFMVEHNIEGSVLHTHFGDFASARNEALRLATDRDCDYVMFCDADMEFHAEQDYRDRLGAPAYSIATRDASGMEYFNTRLIKSDLAARYVGVTHEYLDIPCEPTPFRYAHYIDHADGGNRHEKFERDIRLLMQGLADEPDNARYMFYLANTLYDTQDYSAAIIWYERRIEAGGWTEELFYSAYRIGQSLLLLGREAEGIARLLDTYDRFPHRAEPLHVLAMHYQRTLRHRASRACCEAAFQIPEPAQALFLETDVYRWRLKDANAVALFYMGRRDEAAIINRDLLDIVPPTERERIANNLEHCTS